MTLIRLLLFLMWMPIFAHAQIITTVAGTGRVEFSGDGGPATNAGMNQPVSITTDKYGSIFVVDAGYNIVRKVTANGLISTVIGNYQEERIHPAKGFEGDDGLATEAVLWKPRCILIDSANVYIGDYENSVIRKVNISGLIHTIAGFPQQQVQDPQNVRLSYSSSDNSNKSRKCFADEHNNKVHCITANGKITTLSGNGKAGYSGDGGPAREAQLNKPWGIAEDSGGNLFIADTYNNAVRKVSIAGIITTIAGNGQAGYSGDGGAATSAQINGPHGIAIDREGNLFISDAGNNVVRRVDTNGMISTFAGTGRRGYSGDNGFAASAQLNWPCDVVTDTSGNLYIADGGNHVVRKVTPSKKLQKKELLKEQQRELLKVPQLESQKVVDHASRTEPLMEIHIQMLTEPLAGPLEEMTVEPIVETRSEPLKEDTLEFMIVPLIEPYEIPVRDAFRVIADPEKNELVVTTDSAAFTSFTIVNTTGKIFIQQSLSEVKTNVDISMLPTGRYFINLIKEDKVKTAMFVKDK